MSFIIEYRIETPILQEALEAVPDMMLHTESLHSMADEPSRGVVWAWGDDFPTFERGLGTDPTVAEFECLTELGDRHLYRVTFSEAGERVFTYPVAARHDIVLLDMTGSHEGLNVRARVPSREALFAYRDACRRQNVPFHLGRLYREEGVAGDGGRDGEYGVTDAQREALTRCLERGYFDVPRETTLAEVADDLGISVQALSTRLRRGQENLLRATLAR